MAMIKAVSSRVYSKSQEHGHKRNLRMCKMPGTESSTMFLQLQGPERVNHLLKVTQPPVASQELRICSWSSNSSLPTSSLGFQLHKASFIYFLNKNKNAAFKSWTLNHAFWFLLHLNGKQSPSIFFHPKWCLEKPSIMILAKPFAIYFLVLSVVD